MPAAEAGLVVVTWAWARAWSIQSLFSASHKNVPNVRYKNATLGYLGIVLISTQKRITLPDYYGRQHVGNILRAQGTDVT